MVISRAGFRVNRDQVLAVLEFAEQSLSVA
jgi:hypothetical protein